jgi:Fe-S cluster assembly iron-binding protein IscA
MLTLTDSAIRKFKEFVEKEGTPGSGVKIFLVGGC